MMCSVFVLQNILATLQVIKMFLYVFQSVNAAVALNLFHSANT
jgi:hypothetical protein